MTKNVALLAFTVALAQASPAAAGDLRFCVATNFVTRLAYLTQPFRDNTDPAELEKRMTDVMRANGIVLSNVQCPLPPDAEIDVLTRIEKSRSLLNSMGFTVIEIGKARR